jgi:hypothetical protein
VSEFVSSSPFVVEVFFLILYVCVCMHVVLLFICRSLLVRYKK